MRLRSESVSRSARRRATREGCCASPPVKERGTDFLGPGRGTPPGAIVHEVDLDADDDAERDEGALVDDEAEEGNDDDDE